MTVKDVANFKGKLTCGLKNNIRNLVIFPACSWKWKFALSSDPFVQSIQRFRWKITQALWLMKFDARFDMRNLVNFNLSSSKSENLNFDVLLLPIVYKVSAKKVLKNCLSWHWKKTKAMKKNDFLFEKWHEKFGEL